MMHSLLYDQIILAKGNILIQFAHKATTSGAACSACLCPSLSFPIAWEAQKTILLVYINCGLKTVQLSPFILYNVTQDFFLSVTNKFPTFLSLDQYSTLMYQEAAFVLQSHYAHCCLGFSAKSTVKQFIKVSHFVQCKDNISVNTQEKPLYHNFLEYCYFSLTAPLFLLFVDLCIYMLGLKHGKNITMIQNSKYMYYL